MLYCISAGRCNAQLMPNMACQLNALGRHRLDAGVPMFACGGGGPVSIMPCQLVPRLKVRRIISAVSPPACLAIASHNARGMPCLNIQSSCEYHNSVVRERQAELLLCQNGYC